MRSPGALPAHPLRAHLRPAHHPLRILFPLQTRAISGPLTEGFLSSERTLGRRLGQNAYICPSRRLA